MLVLDGRNVNTLFVKGLTDLRRLGVRQPSRAGDVLVAPYPVMSVYERPWERVLFDSDRDANPFFHLMESIWMIAGRNDARFLNRFVKDFGERFAEEDGILHGAYGTRWRYHFSVGEESVIDQIDTCVLALRKNPEDRRVVISMWDPSVDLGAVKKDLPCNTQIYPRIVGGRLDLTVMCRSNDIIWGAYGANAVHFSFLQEVMAAGVGVEMGRMYQFSNNWHGYMDILEKQHPSPVIRRFYETGMAAWLPLVDNYDSFRDECEAFCEDCGPDESGWQNMFFPVTALPMLRIHQMFRDSGALYALNHCQDIGAPDWRLACQNWLKKRIK